MNLPLTMLIHGDAGTGKSWLGNTVPAPRLILDAEGRSIYLPGGPKVTWDPREQAPLAMSQEKAARRRLLEHARAHVQRSISRRDHGARLQAQLRELRLEWGKPADKAAPLAS